MQEMVVITMLGDTMLGLVAPRRHTRRWAKGPWAPMMRWFADRPMLTRIASALGLVVAIVWARRLETAAR